MRAFVSGASGYIGAHLIARLLRDGHAVHALVRPSSDRSRLPREATVAATDGSYASLETELRAARPDVVFHLAGGGHVEQSGAAIEPVLEANFNFGARLLEAMAQTGCARLVNCGTYWEYGSAGEVAPNGLYAAAKHAFQDLLAYHAGRRGLNAVTTVLFDVYGPTDWRRRRLIAELVATALEGRALPASGGEQRLDLVHVDDVVEGLLRAAQLAEKGHQVYALDSGRRRSLREVAGVIEAVSGRKLRVEWGALPYRPGQIFEPVAALPRLPGWSARVTLDEGVRRLLT